MPREMRFCRACGFRLGEGVAEFTETVRLHPKATGGAKAQATGAPQAQARGAASVGYAAPAAPKWNTYGSVKDWGALARDIGQNVVQSATTHLEGRREKLERKKQKCHRSKWTGWLIAIVIFSVMSSGGFMGLSGLRNRLRGGSSSSSEAARSWFGSSDFQEADNGVTFEQVEPAGSPADKAGLVGGDVITSFDNQPVKTPRELRRLLTATPVGKTVEVVYIRDGETRTTKLTTISQAEMEQLEGAANSRGKGFVGIGGDSDVLAVPGTNITGVQLNSVRRNNPAYLAGMRDGDIVIEFDGVPIRTYDELESRTRRAVPDSTVKVVVMRGAERKELFVKVGIAD
jgi:hypothetical protein